MRDRKNIHCDPRISIMSHIVRDFLPPPRLTRSRADESESILNVLFCRKPFIYFVSTRGQRAITSELCKKKGKRSRGHKFDFTFH